MNSKADILNKIKKNKPRNVQALPSIKASRGGSFTELVTKSIQLVGGNTASFVEVANSKDWFQSNLSSGKGIHSSNPDIPGDLDLKDPITREDLEKIKIAILDGLIGVAENGAIWIDNLKHRAIPFIAEHLILVINEQDIMETMHEAYEYLKDHPTRGGFGCFISGPSKTADIEQSLVYGAHGPKSLTVLIKNNNE